MPFGPLEVRLYTTWDETAPAGSSNTLDALRKTDAKAAAIFAQFEAYRSLLQQLISGPGTPSRQSLHHLRNQIETLALELEERMAGGSSKVSLGDSILLPVRIGPLPGSKQLAPARR